jgi:hypothetical protein
MRWNELSLRGPTCVEILVAQPQQICNDSDQLAFAFCTVNDTSKMEMTMLLLISSITVHRRLKMCIQRHDLATSRSAHRNRRLDHRLRVVHPRAVLTTATRTKTRVFIPDGNEDCEDEKNFRAAGI